MAAVAAVVAGPSTTASASLSSCSVRLSPGALNLESYTKTDRASAYNVCLDTGYFSPDTNSDALVYVGNNVHVGATPSSIAGSLQFPLAGFRFQTQTSSNATVESDVTLSNTTQVYFNNDSPYNKTIAAATDSASVNATASIPSGWTSDFGSSNFTTDPTNSDRRIEAVTASAPRQQWNVDGTNAAITPNSGQTKTQTCRQDYQPSSSTYHFVNENSSSDTVPYPDGTAFDDNATLGADTYADSPQINDRSVVFYNGSLPASWSGSDAWSEWSLAQFPDSTHHVTACTMTHFHTDYREDGIADTNGKGDRESGIPFVTSTVRGVEADYGINHPLGLDLAGSASPSNYISPAIKTNPGSNSGSTPYGVLLKLKSSYTIPSGASAGQTNVINAIKKYGVYVVDDGNGSVASLNFSRRGTSDTGTGLSHNDLGYLKDAFGDNGSGGDNTIAGIQALGLDVTDFDVVCTPSLVSSGLVAACHH